MQTKRLPGAALAELSIEPFVAIPQPIGPIRGQPPPRLVCERKELEVQAEGPRILGSPLDPNRSTLHAVAIPGAPVLVRPVSRAEYSPLPSRRPCHVWTPVST